MPKGCKNEASREYLWLITSNRNYAVDASISRDPQAKTDVSIAPTTLRQVS